MKSSSRSKSLFCFQRRIKWHTVPKHEPDRQNGDRDRDPDIVVNGSEFFKAFYFCWSFFCSARSENIIEGPKKFPVGSTSATDWPRSRFFGPVSTMVDVEPTFLVWIFKI